MMTAKMDNILLIAAALLGAFLLFVAVGLGIALRSRDPFRKLLGADWNKTHWFGTAAERDAALAEMSRKHEYSRAGDKPALQFEKVEKLHESRGL